MGIKRFVYIAVLIVLLGTFSGMTYAGELMRNVIFESGFEDGMQGFYIGPGGDRFDASAATQVEDVHNGKKALIIQSSIPDGWNLGSTGTKVKAGQVYEVELWLKADQGIRTWLVFGTKDAQDNDIDTMEGAYWINSVNDWTHVRTRITISKGVAFIHPRLGAKGKGKVLIDDYKFRLVEQQEIKSLPDTLQISNSFLDVSFDTKTLLMKVTDKRSNKTWTQNRYSNDMYLTNAQVIGNEIHLEQDRAIGDLKLKVTLALKEDTPELNVQVSGDGDIPDNFVFPQPFATKVGSRLVIPQQEGMEYPAEDSSISEYSFEAYAGGAVSMPFYGTIEGNQSYMSIINTPDDAIIQMSRMDNLLCAMTVWEGQKGQLGYSRKLTYVFFDKGSIVPMAKRYREEAKSIGIFKTLSEKRKENPNIDKLVGAANIWMGYASPSMPSQLKSMGINRILWSVMEPTEKGVIKQLQENNQLVSSYDIYQDVSDPALGDLGQGAVKGAWPKDLLVNKFGEHELGWKGPKDWNDPINGGYNQYHIMCDMMTMNYSKKWLETELESFPYKARFTDTLTCSSFKECYSLEHPMTRTQSKNARIELLKYNSVNKKLVTGSENGIASFVPYLSYVEGMMSIGNYRDSSAGVAPGLVLNKIEPQVEKYQLNQKYRIPLWELVFHDCIVSYWYWGDGSNKFPTLWPKRDLYNALYGTPPLYFFDMEFWDANKARFKQSYNVAAPVARATGYSEMADFQYLSANRDVQMTSFANNVKVIVNFGSKPYEHTDGTVINAMNYKTYGME